MSKLPALLKLLRKGDLDQLSEHLHTDPTPLNQLEPKTGKALLHLALESADDAAVSVLTRFPGIDLELPTRDGELPLQIAVRLNDVRLVGLLLQLKADPRRRNNYGDTVLCAALCQQTHRDILKQLFKHIDPNERLQTHGSYLNLSLSAPHSNNFHMLMQENVNYTIKDDHDNTALILAVRANKGDCVVAILNKLAADPLLAPVEKQFFFNAQNFEGNTALHEAVLRDYQTITQKLEAFGSTVGFDASLKNKKGQTVEAIRLGREKARISQAELEKKRQEERVVRRREKEEEKIRTREQEERIQAEQKRKKKQEEERALLEARIKSETQKKQTLWIAAILFVIVLGGMYLMLTNAIEKQKAPTF